MLHVGAITALCLLLLLRVPLKEARCLMIRYELRAPARLLAGAPLQRLRRLCCVDKRVVVIMLSARCFTLRATMLPR